MTVNPDTVAAQVEGSIVFGLTAALFGQITLKDGRVEQSNFHDYPMLRMHQMPEIEVHIADSSAPPGSVGEPAYRAGAGQRLLCRDGPAHPAPADLSGEPLARVSDS